MYYVHQNPQDNSMWSLLVTVGGIVLLLAIGITAYNSYYVVDQGYTALQLRFGRIVTVADQAGLYVKMPFVDTVVQIDRRICKAEIETTALSHDLQSLSVGVVMNYKVSDPVKLYQDIGSQFLEVIIDPFTQESVKVVVANFTAEDIIQRRQEAKQRVIDELRMRLEKRHIQLIDFNFTHLDFSQDFIRAVEEKQIAEQHAKTARNLTEKVKEEALQTMKRAEAEAFALKVKKEAAASSELIQLMKIEAQLRAIEKWNGVLPTMTGSQVPFINVG